jgi:opacity protein-like surface antigen
MTMRPLIIAAAGAAALFSAAAAQAQEEERGFGVYIGVQGGYHHYAENNKGGLVGGYMGVNIPAGEAMVVGVEANANFGVSGPKTEYGGSAHLGYRLSNGIVFGRVGYQEVDIEGPGRDGDMMYGIGGEFGVGEGTAFRVVFDTVGFDTTRITAGLTFHF